MLAKDHFQMLLEKLFEILYYSGLFTQQHYGATVVWRQVRTASRVPKKKVTGQIWTGKDVH